MKRANRLRDAHAGPPGLLGGRRLGIRLLERSSFLRRRYGFGAPPRDGGRGDGGGGGGGGGGGDGAEPGDGGFARVPEEFPVGAVELGFGFLMIAVTTLFAVFLGAFFYLRRTAPEWPPPGSPAAPDALWLSTAMMLASSAALVRSARRHRLHDRAGARAWLIATELLGVGFLLSQLLLWRDLAEAGLSTSGSYGTVFYALTGLHGAHVLAGLVYMLRLHTHLIAGKIPRRGRTEYDFCGWYWHYMGVVWLVVFSLLYFWSR